MVAEGGYREAVELPRGARGRPRRSMEAPDERFAALLGAREPLLVCEELVVRARGDLAAGRTREAALQARVALEGVLSELAGRLPGEREAELEGARAVLGDAANMALRGRLDEASVEGVEDVVDRMEAVLRTRRLGSAS